LYRLATRLDKEILPIGVHLERDRGTAVLLGRNAME